MNPSLNTLGLCLGASTVSLVTIRTQKQVKAPAADGAPFEIVHHAVFPHDGDPKQTLLKALETVDWQHIDKVAATGRKFCQFLNLSSIGEPEAVEQAYKRLKPAGVHCPAVISAGGETFMVYVLNPVGQIANVITGNKCAAGTGEFFLQQLRRMDVTLEEAGQWAEETEPYHVSGRCSVFCKSDCTHATNKGVPKARVTAGLGKMMANKVLELLKKVERRNLMLVGGTARNQMMVRYLREAVPGLIIPEAAPYFEALGAALWALDNETRPFPGVDRLFTDQTNRFDVLPPLAPLQDQVTFKTLARDTAREADVCLLGLDVGSTTTKAVLLRRKDYALLADVYLRTNGDPVGASRRCYEALLEQVAQTVDPDRIQIVGLGVCGSGRQIAGLHALTDGVINEIIAHATASVYFDRDVDTIFEIGGQDAKYTYITNGVPSDYAMNEACSAGTGSFLEESALETLGVAMERIADVALKAQRPPNFNDQCAAFIASDIKNAIHDGVAHEDILAGLVYSICMNYNNRVKGNRPMGKKIFMQGGVCYNRAVPLAMAGLTGKPIVVPPEPGLMGAFGAALEVHKRINAGLMQPGRFDLQTLSRREAHYGRSFICKGGAEGCDRRCEIARITVEGQVYPFGGACNRYDNLRRNKRYDVRQLDLVRLRQQLLFGKYAPAPLDPSATDYRGRVGINRSFLVNTYYPLYAHFFSRIGYAPVLPRQATQEGIDQRNAPFCYPVELAHGFFHDLLAGEDPPEVLFLPHFKSMPALNGDLNAQVCPLVQGESFYLQSTFRPRLQQLEQRGSRLFAPLIDLAGGLEGARSPLVEMAAALGIRRKAAEAAFDQALAAMQACMDEMLAVGRDTLATLARDPQQMAVVLFGRAYSAYVDEAHKGIPHKFASRGVLVIPLDFLDLSDQYAKRHMYWGAGQRILAAARKVKEHPQLFGTYITNFSCGPDSFVITYFRDIMGRKPSLTLELDSHTADAGLETRIEAFLDIVQAYRQLGAEKAFQPVFNGFRPAGTTVRNGVLHVIDSSGRELPYTDPRVTLLFPAMGDLAVRAVSATFASYGFHTRAHEPSNEAILKLGRGNTSCKECLPLILTTGTLLNYAQHKRRSDEVVLYFMPTGSGPCRFGQYYIFMEDLVRKLQIPDVAMFSLSSDDGYAGLPTSLHRRGWWAVVVSDLFEDMRAMLLANARDTAAALDLFEQQYQSVLSAMELGAFDTLLGALTRAARKLAAVPLKRPVPEVPVVSLMGEIYVRRDGLSRQYLTEQLAAKGIATVCAPVAEWILYSDFIINKGYGDYTHDNWREKLNARVKQLFMRWDDRRIRKALAVSGLVHTAPIRVGEVIDTARPYISPYLAGEAILTVGSSLKEVVSQTCGVIAIGPFGCMPNRLAESILNEAMQKDNKLASEPHNARLRTVLADVHDLPFLAIESDGSPFPQLIHAKLEAFCLRAERMHERMRAGGMGNHGH
ncbi:acyl-CoA dehydratase activase [Desulfatitalea alkaliphila]|uniref:Acyl-CoA dehydratase activase n=1 Tax=Desulfatitalea alkaliphila TaxID=2929485 RepID=A0AA41R584_9BACT|nr:acyl-CoA dehydratase activase [Desulfatitalea alkaliphila]MCJ8502056.1 acyl-CoA dehydratase activase [Desulfatitalea alkaliphila]